MQKDNVRGRSPETTEKSPERRDARAELAFAPVAASISSGTHGTLPRKVTLGPRDREGLETPGAIPRRWSHVARADKWAVALFVRFQALGWLSGGCGADSAYDLTRDGSKAFEALGIDIEATRRLRRRFAYCCVDWSERRPHVGGAIGAALLNLALKRKWVSQDLDSRVLTVTGIGRREMLARFGLGD